MPGHGWIDRDELMLHCAFQCLVDCVEKENLLSHEWVSDADQHVKKEIQELYDWWKANPDTEVINKTNYEKANKQFHRLVDIRGYLWT